MRILDLFSGMGGFSYGFLKASRKTGVPVEITAIDSWNYAIESISSNLRITAFRQDLTRYLPEGHYDIVIGGPPCRPWSALNVQKRGIRHPDYRLLSVFYENVFRLRPTVFIMENVPLLANDPAFERYVLKAEKNGYSVIFSVYRYSDFGAATRRRRLFVIGIMGSDAAGVVARLEMMKAPAKTVQEATWDLKDADGFPDHQWSHPRTIYKYYKKYKDGKFGWYILRWNEPAPSFGNVNKTYILHPEGTRVISAREAMRIMGFGDDYIFPPGVPLSAKYQMIADAVSPVFSEKLGVAVIEHLSSTAEMVGEKPEKLSMEI
ncbi:MAG: DNA cytosine methyltransferase [Nitrososphaeria archaeon]